MMFLEWDLTGLPSKLRLVNSVKSSDTETPPAWSSSDLADLKD